MNRRKDNRGSAMVIVIVVIAFVSVLIATLFMMSTINIQMKSVDRKAKDNFYSAEGALEQINLGLQNEIAGAAGIAYTQVMQNYANSLLEVQRRQKFNESFLNELKGQIKETTDENQYSLYHLATYLSDDVESHTQLSSPNGGCRLVQEEDSLVLKGLAITYTDDQNYQTIIETDIRLSVPNLNLVQPSDMPDIFEYSIIANKQLLGSGGGNVTIGANVYAGEDGMILGSGSVWRFNQANRLVVRGAVEIPRTADMSVMTDMDLWAKELDIAGGTLSVKGRTYVANDLVTSRIGSNVTLEGEYYGYGNSERLTDSGLTIPYGGDSSAILINGTQTTLDMTNLRKLLLSGSAQIATGKLTFDKDDIENELPENDPSLETYVKPTTLSSGRFNIQSVGNGSYVCSEGEYRNYLAANRGAAGEWEGFSLVNNSDGTFSLRDYQNKYVSVKMDNSYALMADSDEIGVNEKFYVYLLEGRTGQYALKSYANGKYVSLDTIYRDDNGNALTILSANRDKVTDNSQLFRMSRLGDLPVIPVEVEPLITFTYMNENSVRISFMDPSWGTAGAPNDRNAWITYYVNGQWRGGSVPMPASDSSRRMSIDINLSVGDTLTYTIDYGVAGGIKQATGSYTHNPGWGNSEKGDGTLVDGVYFISCGQWANGNYGQVTAYGNGPIAFNTGNPQENDGSWEKFILVNNEDGTISLMSFINNHKYVSIQEDGRLIASRDHNDGISDNEKFILEYTGEGGYYRLKTLPGSRGEGKYICVYEGGDTPNLANRQLHVAEQVNQRYGHFYFEWKEYTDETGQRTPVEEPVVPNNNPVSHMSYSTEQTATITFTSPLWSGGDGEGVTVFYEINGGDAHSVEMPKNGVNASFTVPGLRNQDTVTYRFTYTYRETNGTIRTVNTSNNIYIHETKYGDAINVQDGNRDIDLGESLEVKSNQIAYLVPAECIGVNDDMTIIGKNPMGTADFTRLMTYANNTTAYPNFEIVSFTKQVEGLGKSLDEYRTAGTDGYKTVFQQTADGTLVYFYVDFDSDNSSKYFREYYEANRSKLEQYMQEYVSEIRMSSRFTRLTTDGNMVYSAGGGTGSIYLKSNEGYGAYLSEAEISGQKNEETGYQKRFQALYRKLILDYADLTQTEKVRDVFDNIIRYSEDAGDPDSHAFAGISQTGISYSTQWEDGSDIKALAIDNKDGAAFHYSNSNDPNGEICLILATGDVVLERDFSGIVIARGIVTVSDSSVNTITGNREKLYKILQTEITNPSTGATETVIEHFFRDGDKYVLDNGLGGVISDRDYIVYSDLITYEDWTKR